MHPIFGRVVAEWSSPSQQISSPAPFLYCVHLNGSDDLTLRVVATDFQSNTFQVIRSRHQLEDLRDDIGIGGSWSEFIDYITTSLKSGDVKLVLDGVSELGEKGSKYHLQKALATEQEKNADLQKQLSMTFYSGKHKSQKINDRKDQGSSSAIVSAESPDKKTASDTNARKGTNRVVPAYRRSKVRGAILNDTEDDA
ncbi:uncharacterized protein LOC121756010 isoform X2 [Salvia splendens]|uniref:uncharacterized protein LOC121756010 isoform X2 n=1 Tax=Salvia splendens TaxID=180675 RepID=UPI001C26F3AB|nr:uncharacterized protein LOC121756010 isoform X2 [Salvia splendens]